MAALLLSNLPACVTAKAIDETAPASCGVERLGSLFGRERAEALEAEALRLSGARRLRWIRPGDMVTMDFSAERLNIHLDAADRIEHFTCG